MDTLGLSLRQKKLLHMLRGMNSYITGKALARQLNVSVRTIRNDVADISPDGILTAKKAGESVVLAIASNGDKEFFAVRCARVSDTKAVIP